MLSNDFHEFFVGFFVYFSWIHERDGTPERGAPVLGAGIRPLTTNERYAQLLASRQERPSSRA
jgi:hypothetical protein